MEEQTQNSPIIESMKLTARNMSGWMKFVGVMSILSGVAAAITIVGILIAWLPIWLGVLLFQAGGRADEASLANRPEQLNIMLSKLRLYFMIQGILLLIMVVISLIGIFGAGASLIPFLHNFR